MDRPLSTVHNRVSVDGRLTVSPVDLAGTGDAHAATLFSAVQLTGGLLTVLAVKPLRDGHVCLRCLTRPEPDLGSSS